MRSCDLSYRMRLREFLIQLNSESWLPGNAKGSIFEAFCGKNQFRAPIGFAPLQFQQPEVCHPGANLRVCRSRDWTTGIMRSYGDRLSTCHRCEEKCGGSLSAICVANSSV